MYFLFSIDFYTLPVTGSVLAPSWAKWPTRLLSIKCRGKAISSNCSFLSSCPIIIPSLLPVLITHHRNEVKLSGLNSLAHILFIFFSSFFFLFLFFFPETISTFNLFLFFFFFFLLEHPLLSTYQIF